MIVRNGEWTAGIAVLHPEPALEIRLPHVVAGILPGPRERPALPGLLNADAAASMQDAVYIVFADMLTILLHCT